MQNDELFVVHRPTDGPAPFVCSRKATMSKRISAYFLLTFTLPEKLRPVARCHHRDYAACLRRQAAPRRANPTRWAKIR